MIDTPPDPARKALDIVDLRRKAERATSGPWELVEWGEDIEGVANFYWRIRRTAMTDGNVHSMTVARTYGNSLGDTVDANHIAAFDPPTALALLDEIVSLRAALEAAEGKVVKSEADLRTVLDEYTKISIAVGRRHDETESLSDMILHIITEQRAKAREDALEEAARLAEDLSTEQLENPHEIWLHGFNVAQTAIGKAIRALKPIVAGMKEKGE